MCTIDGYFPRETYSITDLCEYVGISRQAYYAILKGDSIPRLDVALRIVDYFNSISSKRTAYSVNTFWWFSTGKE